MNKELLCARFNLAQLLMGGGIAGVVIVTVSLFSQNNLTEPCRTTVSIGTVTYVVEVADTPAARERGLSGRESLAEKTGMLFVFEKSLIPGFWMKDMRFPIDIVWIRENKTVAGVVENFTPASFPRVENPDEPVRYVLEIPAGTVKKEKVELNAPVAIRECRKFL